MYLISKSIIPPTRLPLRDLLPSSAPIPRESPERRKCMKEGLVFFCFFQLNRLSRRTLIVDKTVFTESEQIGHFRGFTDMKAVQI